MSDRVRRVNEIGAGFKGIGCERMKDFVIFEEGGRVLVRVEVPILGDDEQTTEVLQYLTAEEAMFFAKAFERCAIEALKKGAE